MEKNPVTKTEHNGLCEECSRPLTKENVVEGDFGFYCSDGCLEEFESGLEFPYREDFHSDI